MPAGRPSKYKPEFCGRVIEMGKYGASFHEMALEMDIHIDTFIEWRKVHPEFSVAVNQARTSSQGWWEKIGRTATVGQVEGFNATAFIFNMKNRFKDDWRDKQEIDNTHDLSDPMKALFGEIAAKGKRVGE